MEAAEPATNCKFSMKLGGVPVLLSLLEESGTHPNTYPNTSYKIVFKYVSCT